MKKIKDILTESERKGVLTFGRFQPPHEGHDKVIQKVLGLPGTKRIYVSHVHDDKNNPLSQEDKLSLLYKMYPNHKHFFKSSSKEEPTIFHALRKMHEEGIKHVTVVAGEDRIPEFTKNINAYNGKFDEHGKGYNFKSINVVSSGDRDADSNEVDGISGSKIRDLSRKGDYKSVRPMMHRNLSEKDVREVMKKIADASGNNGDIKIGDKVKTESHHGEILSIGKNYAVILEGGKEVRIWTDDITEVTISESKRNQLYKESFIYKGYKTENFTKELSEHVKELSRYVSDEYAMLNAIKSIDFLLPITEESLYENFMKVKVELERLIRYNNKFNLAFESLIEDTEEMCLKYAILEGKKFLTTDKMMIARMIAAMAGIAPFGNDPIAIINKSATMLRQSQLTPQGYALLGRAFKVVDDADIRWSKTIFSTPQLTLMGL